MEKKLRLRTPNWRSRTRPLLLLVALAVASFVVVQHETTLSIELPSFPGKHELPTSKNGTENLERRSQALRLFRALIRTYCNQVVTRHEMSSLSPFEQTCVNETEKRPNGVSEWLCSRSASLPQQLAEEGNWNGQLHSQWREFVNRCSVHCAPYLRANKFLSTLILKEKGSGSVTLRGGFRTVIHDYAVVHSQEMILDRIVPWRSPPDVSITHPDNVDAMKPLVRGLSCIVSERPTHGPLAHFVGQIFPYFEADFPCQTYVFPKTPAPLVKNEDTFYGLVSKLTLDQTSNMLFPKDLYWRKNGVAFEHIAVLFNRISTMIRSSTSAMRFKRKAWHYLGFSQGGPRKTCLFKRSNGRNPENFNHLLELLENVFGKVDILHFNSKVPMKVQARGFYSCWLLVSPHGSHNINILFSQPGSYFLELSPPKYRSSMYQDFANRSGVHYLRTCGSPAGNGAMKDWQDFSVSECMNNKLCRQSARETSYNVNLTEVDNKLRTRIAPLGNARGKVGEQKGK
eukprot:gb/GECG01011293.1/.p1 GENE.gb/GECG01011293.1/~~gb/GECG01011293.1/.p1  ORF type:complete len:513 (+),score=33.44 gb/GECG01011293.1/:1-1539(+)